MIKYILCMIAILLSQFMSGFALADNRNERVYLDTGLNAPKNHPVRTPKGATPKKVKQINLNFLTLSASMPPPLLTIDRCDTIDKLSYELGGNEQYCFQFSVLKPIHQAGNQTLFILTLAPSMSALVLAKGKCAGQPCQFQMFAGNTKLLFGANNEQADHPALAYSPKDANAIAAWKVTQINTQDNRFVYNYGGPQSEPQYMATVRIYGKETQQAETVGNKKLKPIEGSIFSAGVANMPLAKGLEELPAREYILPAELLLDHLQSHPAISSF